jgi:hypothetical protein
MPISNHIAQLTALALKDRVLTSVEKKIIIDEAVKEGISEAEVTAYINNALKVRLQHYAKEDLKCCPNCGSQIPLISDDCLFCGIHLVKSTGVSQVNAGGSAASVINKENVNTEKERMSLKNCPNCGAPFPLISNVCGHCGHVLHQQADSEFNIGKLLGKISQSIERLRNAPNPTFFQVVVFRLDFIMFYFAAAFLMLTFFGGTGYLCLSVSFLAVAFVLLLKKKDVNSPVQLSDEEFYNALYAQEMYLRQTDTIYGDNNEARQLINDLSSEIEKIKKQRTKNRNTITVLFSVLMLVPIVLYIIAPSTKQVYENDRRDFSAVYQTAEFSKTLKPLPGYSVHDNYQKYLKAQDETSILIDPVLFYPRVSEHTDELKYCLRIEPVNLVSTGVKITEPDTCFLRIFLWDKNQKPVGKDIRPIKIRFHDNDDDIQVMLKNGFGHYEADFVSEIQTESPDRLKEIADSAYYYTVY